MEEFKRAFAAFEIFCLVKKKALTFKHPLLYQDTEQLLQWVLTLSTEILWLSNFNAFVLFVLNFWLSLSAAVC